MGFLTIWSEIHQDILPQFFLLDEVLLENFLVKEKDSGDGTLLNLTTGQYLDQNEVGALT